MFNLKEFVVTNIVNGVKNGTWTKEYANIMAVNYLSKGILGIEDVAAIDAEITAWENEKKANETVEEEPTVPETEEPEQEVVEEPETEEPETDVE